MTSNSAFKGLKEGGRNVEDYREFMAVLKRGLTTYADFFEQRFEQGYVKCCHGDLKTPNIWIVENDLVQILDSIDFNPLFCHIDVLSDVAMLVVDIQARMSSVKLVNGL